MSTTPNSASPRGDVGEGAYQATDRTTATRYNDRVSYDHAVVHAILDASYLCHLSFIADGAPVVLPTLFARVGQRLYLHGSTGSRPLRFADTGGTDEAGGDAGLPVCVAVTVVDGIVLARSAFRHSFNYRSVVVHGIAHRVNDLAERALAFDALVDQVIPGRAADTRQANAKEHAATALIRVDLREVSAKIRSAGPNDHPEDVDLPYWAGVLPVTTGYGTPIPADDLDPTIPIPGYLPGRSVA